jgi:hypothetical protein
MDRSGQQKLPDGIHTKALNDGNVEFRFVAGGKELAAGYMTAAQLSSVVANLLNAAHNAFHNADKQLAPTPKFYQGEPTHVARWALGQTKQQNQQVLIVEVGEATIAFVVPPDKIRELARYLIVASHHPQSILSLRAFLRAAVLDFLAGLRGFSSVFNARLKASSRRHAISFLSRISGRSLRTFRTIKIAPGVEPPKYNPIEKCIYCGAMVYSTRPGGRARPFGAEHIVPESIGGTLELPEASCQKCEDTTGRIVEGDALGRTLKALRVHLKLKKAGSGSHPKVLPLTVNNTGQDTTIPDVPIDIYPIAFMLPIYMPPEFSATAINFGKNIRGALVANVKLDMKTLFKRYNISSFAPAYWDNAMLCRMLAKIGHSLAIAELGETVFRPLLIQLICNGDAAGMSLIGCSPEYEKVPHSTALHVVGLGYQRHDNKNYVVASIRLFASYDGPIYRVVVGESLESSIARAKRVFSNRISSILLR